MKKKNQKFKVALHRSYMVEMIADSEKSAKECAEFFIGDVEDKSSPLHQKKYSFHISSIEMIWNDAEIIK